MEIYRSKFYNKQKFQKITNNDDFKFDRKIELINDFEHNYITLINGEYKSCDIQFEDKEKVKIENLKSFGDFHNQSKNNLLILNKALSSRWI